MGTRETPTKRIEDAAGTGTKPQPTSNNASGAINPARARAEQRAGDDARARSASFVNRRRAGSGSTTPQPIATIESASESGTRSTKASPRKTTKPKPKVGSAVKGKQDELTPHEFAGAVIAGLEVTTSALVGEPVPMDELPKALMQNALGNMMERMNPAQMEQFSRITDPLTLIVCAGVYVAKILTIMNAKKASEDEAETTEPDFSRDGAIVPKQTGSIGGTEDDRERLREVGVGDT